MRAGSYPALLGCAPQKAAGSRNSWKTPLKFPAALYAELCDNYFLFNCAKVLIGLIHAAASCCPLLASGYLAHRHHARRARCGRAPGLAAVRASVRFIARLRPTTMWGAVGRGGKQQDDGGLARPATQSFAAIISHRMMAFCFAPFPFSFLVCCLGCSAAVAFLVVWAVGFLVSELLLFFLSTILTL